MEMTLWKGLEPVSAAEGVSSDCLSALWIPNFKLEFIFTQKTQNHHCLCK
ncbi:MAG: hypothetical protein MJB12_08855 [Firmicutes bacterium]|nr:hypothetical protein [Bacillota bacterium]